VQNSLPEQGDKRRAIELSLPANFHPKSFSMNEYGVRAEGATVADLGLKNVAAAYWNLTPAELVEETLLSGQGTLTDTGALAVDTGEFTGRSPKDRFVVCDATTENSVWWGDINIKFTPENFDRLYDKVTSYLQNKEVYVRDSYACADPKHRLNIRVVTEYPWSNLFASNLFLRPELADLKDFKPDWTVICAPGYGRHTPEELCHSELHQEDHPDRWHCLHGRDQERHLLCAQLYPAARAQRAVHALLCQRGQGR